MGTIETAGGATPLPITAIVMTLNERRNLPACLASIAGHVQSVVVVDSYSTDETEAIARSFGCVFLQHPFTNQAQQFQWALDNAPIPTDWVLRIDADERWTEQGFQKLTPYLSDPEIAGVHVSMKIMFMGRFLRHGGLYGNHFMRVFRKAGAHVEQRWMDEHIIVAGRSIVAEIDVIEANYDRQHHLGLWTTKHNGYSTREAADALVVQHKIRPLDTVARLGGGKTATKRWIKENVFLRAPLFVRPLAYFGYRYLVKLGFLDGTPGLVFHVLQGFWYRFLVDAKIYQVNLEARRSGRSVREVMRELYGIEL